MIIVALLLAFEGLMVNLIMNPSDAAEHNVLGMTFFVINSLILFTFILLRGTKSNRLNKWLAGSFVLRLFFVLWDIYARSIFVLPNSEGDAISYHTIAVSYAFGSRANQSKIGYYPFYVSKLYRLIGVQKITVHFLNVFLAICSLILIFKILEILDIDQKIAENVVILTGMLPNAMIITSIFLYESMISFMIVLSLYFFVLFFKGGHWLSIIPAVAISALAGMTHLGGVVVAIGFMIALPFIYGPRKEIKFNLITMVSASVMIVVVMAFMLRFGDVFLAKIGGTLDVDTIIYKAEELYDDGGSGYTIGFDGLSGLTGLIVNTPVRMVYFIGAPFPWNWRGLSDIIAFFGSALFYILTIFNMIRAYSAGIGIKNKGGIWSMLFILTLSLLALSIVFGWGVSNAGSALRHREKFTYVFAVMLAVATQIVVDHRKKNDWKAVWQ